MPTPAEAKKIITDALLAAGVPKTEFKLSAKTIDFTDLARTTRVFVTVKLHVKYMDASGLGAKGFVLANDLSVLAVKEGFRVDFKYDQDSGDKRFFVG